MAGGGDNTGEVMRATLSGDGCRYEGSTTRAPGSFALHVRNDTNEEAYFVLMMLPKDATLKDVEAWFHQALRRLLQTGKYVLRPPIAWVTSTRVAAHAPVSFPSICFGGPGWPSFARAAAGADTTSSPPPNWR